MPGGGILQGIGMALTENITYDHKGKVLENSLKQYKIPTRTDFGHIRVEFENSYEKAGHCGCRLPCHRLRFRELPITSGQIAIGLLQK